jgi:hypothetical protein
VKTAGADDRESRPPLPGLLDRLSKLEQQPFQK